MQTQTHYEKQKEDYLLEGVFITSNITYWEYEKDRS